MKKVNALLLADIKIKFKKDANILNPHDMGKIKCKKEATTLNPHEIEKKN